MSMKTEDFRKVAIGLPKLRKKEMTSKLTYGEQEELESLLMLDAQNHPDNREKHLASNVKLTALRNYTIVDVTPKAGIFQKLFKQENTKEYKLRILEEDIASNKWLYSLALDMRQLMEDVGLGLDWPKMMPVDDDMFYTDPLEEDDKEWFESFLDPALCYAKLDEAAELEEKAAAHSPEMLRAIQWLKEQWKNGYQIYADVGDLFDYYGDDELE
ncbi:hypothetical protein [Sporosarcina sp. SAFN-015]|uniref:hypothetical protein n=1 Tax=Sporosarcina sp. SAFN-015 TaxID=3387274 RepID=UPI003F7E7404